MKVKLIEHEGHVLLVMKQRGRGAVIDESQMPELRRVWDAGRGDRYTAAMESDPQLAKMFTAAMKSVAEEPSPKTMELPDVW